MQYSGGSRISKTEASKPKCVGAKLLMGQMFPQNSMKMNNPGSTTALDALLPAVQFFKFSCSFWHIFSQIIGWLPPLENPGSPAALN